MRLVTSLGLCVIIPAFTSSFAASLDEGSGLEFQLAPDAIELMQYEPLGVTVSVRNTSGAPMDSSRVSAFPSGLEYHASYAGGEYSLFDYSLSRRLSGLRFAPKPGEAIVVPQILFLRDKDLRPEEPFVFDKPGVYKLRARFPEPRGWCESNEVTLHVKPIPPDCRAEVEVITSPIAARTLQGWDSEPNGIKMLQNLLLHHPCSIYADHIRYVLGELSRSKCFVSETVDLQAARQSFQLYAAISPRIGAMRVRALLRMGELLRSFPNLNPGYRTEDLVQELEGYHDIVASIGRQKDSEELMKTFVLSQTVGQ